MTYYDWLVFTIAPSYYQRDQYSELLFALYSMDYYWVVSRDRNRAEDGLELRSEYERKTGLYCDKYGPCSCLEMMVALAIRCENELMYDPDEGDRTDFWFWTMIDNLELSQYTDEEFNYEAVDDIMHKFMERDYGSNGEFCMFFDASFGKKFDKSFKKMELAYQLNHYIDEKYY